MKTRTQNSIAEEFETRCQEARHLSQQYDGLFVVFQMRRLGGRKVTGHAVRRDQAVYQVLDGYAFSPLTAFRGGEEARHECFAK